MDLSELGTWINGYRPTHIRITYDSTAEGNLVATSMWDKDENTIAGSASVFRASGELIPISYQGFDIDELFMRGDVSGPYFEITGIDFLVP